jgi:hypothetical protein
MFVRWKRREELWRIYDPERVRELEIYNPRLWFSEPTGVWIRTAYLIKAYRTEKGPRQRYLSRLGSIEEGQESDPDARACFWKDVEYGLSKVESISGFRVGHDFVIDRDPDVTIRWVDRIEPFTFTAADRERIVASLEAVVPRPDPERVKEAPRRPRVRATPADSSG